MSISGHFFRDGTGDDGTRLEARFEATKRRLEKIMFMNNTAKVLTGTPPLLSS